MSTEYYLVCNKHKHKVHVCSDGLSGPMNQCDWSLAYFLITNRDCELRLIDEHEEEEQPFCDYIEFDEENKKDLIDYDLS